MPVAGSLDALRALRDLDPTRTPIGAFAGTVSPPHPVHPVLGSGTKVRTETERASL
jgi:hypothetical protein